jgi:hypothetical protein
MYFSNLTCLELTKVKESFKDYLMNEHIKRGTEEVFSSSQVGYYFEFYSQRLWILNRMGELVILDKTGYMEYQLQVQHMVSK